MIYKLTSSFNGNLKEDLFQVGILGLINAYKNYDEAYNTKFSTYAYPYIIGEMKKYIRENNGMKISRDIVYLSSRLDRLIELLCQKYSRMPTTKELSEEVQVEEWKIIEALNIRNCIKSLDEPLNDKMTIADVVSSEEEDLTELYDAIDKLDDNEKKIINLRYFMDKSQSEVANITGYSQAKVSREEQKILTKMRHYYSDESYSIKKSA